MSTLHKVKAYFGMAPMEDYDDEYYDDRAPAHGYGRPRFEEGYGRYEGRDYDDPRGEPADYPPLGYRGGYPEEPRYSPVRPREFDRPDLGRPRLGSWLRNSTRGALAMDPRRMAMLFDEGSPLSKITTLRPKDYSEARTIGERFRDGTPVIMDLVSMDNADAKRLVDFAAGLAFALRGSFDKVATKVFLLSPADVDVSPEERRRIAETGFYAYQ
ncbi:cell division protein SepF [Mycobacterium haemophilum]|uniref:Cell division protein SepF n=1 Tax=Mycobacterium haemophilum TaxID=29311 RepID=A0A0I9U2V1_9MYCO|nr:cell division protein SepF [Mycobacterium haemophilum]AKN16869.1 cell division protein SepF [Mycobacterium haemophilum DSM 44634]KLO32078.1 cell division protein SepF [Mycobacterium haemophilum]KLO36429.1 cell division protein SepF [Mycobacterium haemophilum]KLO42314.1 cell division protein SepF [Mycobacterium haemophilum]KLO50115.1 cell division protein SepF [Mycobacterium haemophilum]